jgi:hypothetical protein
MLIRKRFPHLKESLAVYNIAEKLEIPVEIIGEGIFPAFSPDGKTLAYLDDNRLLLHRMDDDRGERIIPIPFRCNKQALSYLKWSYDGECLLFRLSARAQNKTVIFNIKDGRTREFDSLLVPDWSPTKLEIVGYDKAFQEFRLMGVWSESVRRVPVHFKSPLESGVNFLAPENTFWVLEDKIFGTMLFRNGLDAKGVIVKVYSLDLKTCLVNLIDVGERNIGFFNVNRSGDLVCFSSTQNWDKGILFQVPVGLYWMNMESKEKRRLALYGFARGFLRGTNYILFISFTGGGQLGLFVVDWESGGVKLLHQSISSLSSMSWSKSVGKLAFEIKENDSSRIGILELGKVLPMTQ